MSVWAEATESVKQLATTPVPAMSKNRLRVVMMIAAAAETGS